MKSLVSLFFIVVSCVAAGPADRLTVLDEFCELYYPNARYPKLITPQWVGEEGVDAVVVLAIDDMRDPKKYEAYLRPILDRLKQVDGRAPVSIMTCNVDLTDPQLQRWLQEGLSLEVHTIDHPCPILDKGDFIAAKSTYDRCVDLMTAIPGNRPCAFRTPCMDGINSASPRLFSEVMMRTARSGRFLTISSSIGVLLTPDDPENPRDLVMGADGKPRFNRYNLPGWVNYVSDYPYPWVIGNSIWETGFCIPDDYQGSRVYGDKGAQTVADMEAAIDVVVAKKGIWVMTFHPYNWIDNQQVAQMVDHVASKYGRRAKFLNLREVQDRLDQNLLAGQPLRAADGSDNGVRVLDLNNDGYLDVVIGNGNLQRTRIWNPAQSAWIDSAFPVQVRRAHFGVLQKSGAASVVAPEGLWHWRDGRWTEVPGGLNGLKLATDAGVRLRDLDQDGVAELVVSNPRQNAIFAWNEGQGTWKRLAYALPEGVSIVTENGRDNGVRFVDFNQDGFDDVIFSNEQEFGLWLYNSKNSAGFTREIVRGKRGEKADIPMIVRGGEYPNNGAWFSGATMFLQNEDTGKMPDLLQRVTLPLQ